MKKENRLEKLEELLKTTKEPLSGTVLAQELQVSRQVIVQDIALLRAKEIEVISTNRGYRIKEEGCRMVVKVCHESNQIEEELNAIVDSGAMIENVFVDHVTYGRLEAPLKIRSRRDIRLFLDKIRKGENEPLTKLTHGMHYHTIQADSVEILQEVKESLDKLGILC